MSVLKYYVYARLAEKFQQWELSDTDVQKKLSWLRDILSPSALPCPVLHVRLPISPMIATKRVEPLLVCGRQFDDPTGVLEHVPAEEPPGVVPAVC